MKWIQNIIYSTLLTQEDYEKSLESSQMFLNEEVGGSDQGLPL